MSDACELFIHNEERNRWLSLDDNALFALCRHENYVASGRGGQKRNKTSNAVRLTHLTTGIAVTDCTTRSQHDNRAIALFKLRCELAMHVRSASTPQLPIDTSIKNTIYPLWIAMIMDRVVTAQFDLKAAADVLGTSRTHLLKLLSRDTVLWQFMNNCRAKLNLSPLHP